VVAVPSTYGEDDVLAHVVCRYPETMTAAGLTSFLRPRLAKFMLPRYIVLGTEPLPRTPTGKVQKDVLRKRGASGAWDAEAQVADVAR
jgi:crotonobetaine/carnitine-CoA ligase